MTLVDSKSSNSGRGSAEVVARDLSRRHIWRRVTLSVAGAVVTDHLRAVNHEAWVVDVSTMSDEVPTLQMGRIITKLTLLRFGAVEVPEDTPVMIHA